MRCSLALSPRNKFNYQAFYKLVHKDRISRNKGLLSAAKTDNTSCAREKKDKM